MDERDLRGERRAPRCGCPFGSDPSPLQLKRLETPLPKDIGTVVGVHRPGTDESDGGGGPLPGSDARSGNPQSLTALCRLAASLAPGEPRASRRSHWGWRRTREVRRRSGGFFRPQPWLQSARDLPHSTAGAITVAVVAAIGILTAFALFTASSQPTLPSSHAVLVAVQPSAGHTAKGDGHLIWYRTGGLLVVVLSVQNLQPNANANALLVPQGSCTGPRPAGTRLLGTVRASSQGVANFNEELLDVSNLKFSAWSIWVDGAGQGHSPTACGVISLSSGALLSS